jgi:hypothetical protein
MDSFVEFKFDGELYSLQNDPIDMTNSQHTDLIKMHLRRANGSEASLNFKRGTDDEFEFFDGKGVFEIENYEFGRKISSYTSCKEGEAEECFFEADEEVLRMKVVYEGSGLIKEIETYDQDTDGRVLREVFDNGVKN